MYAEKAAATGRGERSERGERDRGERNERNGNSGNHGGRPATGGKPGTGPADSYWVIGMGSDGSNGPGMGLSPKAAEQIQNGGGGGLY